MKKKINFFFRYSIFANFIKSNEMTLIQKIQKRSYILVALIAVALISFLFMDIDKNASMLGQSFSDVGEVNGTSLTYETFEEQYKADEARYIEMKGGQALSENEQNQLRTQIWQRFLNEQVVKSVMESAGIIVSTKEMAELTMGANADQQLQMTPAFQNAQGKFDPLLVSNYIKNLGIDDPGTPPGSKRKQWMEFEKQIKESRLNSKFNNLVENSFYVPSWLNDFDVLTFTKEVDFDYVYVPFSSINDKEVKIEESDLKAYFEKYKRKFSDNQEYQKVSYALFPLKPTQTDSIELASKFNEKVALMQSSTNDTNFMRSYADNSFDVNFYKKEDLSRFTNIDALFQAPAGSIVGPFIEKDNFKAVKILGKRNITDSVMIREVVISFKNHMQSQEAVSSRMKFVDSVFKMLDTLNMSFDAVAAQYSEDKGQSPARWTYLTEGLLTREVFQYGGTKKYFKVPSDREGLVRIVQIVNYPATIPAIQIGEISAPYAPSEQTTNTIYSNASNFKNKIKTAKDIEKEILKYADARSSTAFLSPAETQLGGIEGSPRELVRWVFNSKNNEVSNIITIGNHYVVALNLGSRSYDKIEFEMAKEDVKEIYLAEAKSKMLMEKMAKATNLQDAASQFKTTVAKASAVTFQNASFAGSPEPAAVAYSVMAKLNKVSKPIKGFGGVMRILPTRVATQNTDPAQLLDIRAQISMQYKNIKGIVEGMLNTAKVKDLRMNFF
jgi:peptidyl-prolyl cis-trans isomerase D